MLVTRMACSSTEPRPFHAFQSGHILRLVRKEGLASDDQAWATQIVGDRSRHRSLTLGGSTHLSISSSGLTRSHASISHTLLQITSSTTVKGYDFRVGLVRAGSGMASLIITLIPSYVILTPTKEAAATPLSVIAEPFQQRIDW